MLIGKNGHFMLFDQIHGLKIPVGVMFSGACKIISACHTYTLSLQ